MLGPRLKFESMSETLHTMSEMLDLCLRIYNRFVKNEIQNNPFGSVLQEAGILSGIFLTDLLKNFGAAFVSCKIF